MRSHWPRPLSLAGVRAFALTGAVAALATPAAAPQEPPTAARPLPPAPPGDDKPKKLSIDLRVTPAVSFAPARVRAIAELKLPDDRTADFYCAAIEWDWGDLTESEESNECEPYEAGVSEVRRRFAAEHTFQTGGRYRVQLRLRRNRKVLASTSTIVTVRPGVRDYPLGANPEP
jgi:hypothetical protein